MCCYIESGIYRASSVVLIVPGSIYGRAACRTVCTYICICVCCYSSRLAVYVPSTSSIALIVKFMEEYVFRLSLPG